MSGGGEELVECIVAIIVWARKSLKNLIIFLVSLVLVVATLWILIGIETVGLGHQGFVYSDIYGTLDTSEVKPVGRHYVGVFSEIIQWPAYPLELSYTSGMECRTSDKVRLLVKMKMFYSLPKANLKKLYNDHYLDYHNFFKFIAADAVRDAVQNYTLDNLFSNFTSTHREIEIFLKQQFSAYDASLFDFEFLDYSYHNDIREALILTNIEREKIQQAEYFRQVAVVEARTLELNATATANVTMTFARAEAEAMLTTANATATVLLRDMSARVNATVEAVLDYGLNKTETMSYLRNDIRQDHTTGKIVIGMKSRRASA
ncbi:hypothetical protein PCE1_002522 [Barthelona sp. PCE]